MPKLLLIDAGNTRIKWAIAERDAAAGQWLAHGAVTHAEIARLPAQWAAHGVGATIVANVAGAAMRAQLEALIEALMWPGPVEWFVSTPRRGALRNAYRNPAQLGCDRFAAALGARALEPAGPLLVATCGTATTIDAVSADDVFIGGMILPGLDLMSAALASNTAQLPAIDSTRALSSPFADNTVDAILAGCLMAQAGAIERALASHAGARLLLSGGAAARIAPMLAGPHRLVDNIVLVGLHASARAQASGNPAGNPHGKEQR